MTSTIVPKSDQMNADDLIAGPVTITITGVTIKSGEQPISIHYEGDGGKPYKACKSMCRVLVHAWGADSKAYVGRSMTLYRDPSVTWAGMAVGGIRISHMSDIDSKITMALTATKQSRKPYTVQPLTKNTRREGPQGLVAQGEQYPGDTEGRNDGQWGGGTAANPAVPNPSLPTITADEALALEARCTENNVKTANVKKFFNVERFSQLTPAQLAVAHENITATLAKRMEQTQ